MGTRKWGVIRKRTDSVSSERAEASAPQSQTRETLACFETWGAYAPRSPRVAAKEEFWRFTRFVCRRHLPYLSRKKLLGLILICTFARRFSIYDCKFWSVSVQTHSRNGTCFPHPQQNVASAPYRYGFLR